MASQPLPPPDLEGQSLPEYLPARMVNEYVYCPRLFFYEWVEGVFRESADTVEGSQQHKRVDREGKGLPPAGEMPEDLQTRSVTLSSEEQRVIARMDLVEASDGKVTPVDYKHGKPQLGDAGLEMWPTDRVQLALQALVLRENGYVCDTAVVYYAGTKQRVRLAVTESVLDEARAMVRQARETARRGILPPPLEDSPKCVGCSLAPICLPEETNALLRWDATPAVEQFALFDNGDTRRKPPKSEVRRLLTPRDDLRPVYLNTQGLRVGKSGDVLQVKEKDALRQEIRLHEINQLNLMGNIQISTQAVQVLTQAEIPICYFSQGGWFYGITQGLSTKNVFLRRAQFKLAGEEWFCLRLARKLTAGKIRNQRTMLMRNHEDPPGVVLHQMKMMAQRAEEARTLEELLGIEGNAARLYFGEFAGMLKANEEEREAPFSFDFQTRNRRPPRDPANALLSLGYSMLAKDLTIACYAVGFDPMLGFYHQPRFGRPALALDLMEPFRPLIVESAVLQVINTRMVTAKDFIASGRAVALKPEGRKAFFQGYEARMDTLVTHPLFEYRLSYRRMLEVQSRLLAQYIEGTIPEYPVFVTR
ncbi:MAG TPA: CRISPR-associated endonuclease Cas1 [Bryobacteraceae bacterium]|nr:CRISPR-associated endonuclease Cas1 [Bryobacteraceae bacterium]